MKILLTGGAGFIGSYTARKLLASRKHELALLLRRRTDTRRIRDVLLQSKVIVGDLADLASSRQEIVNFRPEAVIHLAWRGVVNSARNDVEQDANVDQALELVRTAYYAGATNWIGLGSQAEYGPCSNRINEQTSCRPTTHYGLAKLAAGRETAALCGELGLRHAWLRLFSSYGPHDDPSWLIPYVALKLLRGERPSTTAGEQRWDYIYAADAATAILAVTENRNASGIYNLGSGTTATVRSIIERVRDLIDPSLSIGFGEIPYRVDQVMHLEADVARLHALGWKPQIDLAEGLSRTVAWCRGFGGRALAAA